MAYVRDGPSYVCPFAGYSMGECSMRLGVGN